MAPCVPLCPASDDNLYLVPPVRPTIVPGSIGPSEVNLDEMRGKFQWIQSWVRFPAKKAADVRFGDNRRAVLPKPSLRPHPICSVRQARMPGFRSSAPRSGDIGLPHPPIHPTFEPGVKYPARLPRRWPFPENPRHKCIVGPLSSVPNMAQAGHGKSRRFSHLQFD